VPQVELTITGPDSSTASKLNVVATDVTTTGFTIRVRDVEELSSTVTVTVDWVTVTQ
jgi:hypothetical protein